MFHLVAPEVAGRKAERPGGRPEADPLQHHLSRGASSARYGGLGTRSARPSGQGAGTRIRIWLRGSDPVSFCRLPCGPAERLRCGARLIL